jgi:hypothetical protein
MDNYIQRCVICGEIIFDYSQACWPSGQIAPKGFSPGELFIEGVNPKSFYGTIEDGVDFKNCK